LVKRSNLNLYFIALIPDDEIRREVKVLKEEMRDNYGSKHALKSPAHITLIAPFRRDQQHENFITEALFRFAAKEVRFSIELDGFNSFEPRVIYVDVKQAPLIKKLHKDLCNYLLDQMLFHPDELKSKLHPHMTIATRDLSQEAYYSAWAEFEKRKYKAAFELASISLLKHNGKFWEIFKTFDFEANMNIL